MTQEYTPVAWQDETTSQQGTLINAERLNQMQQAHHYADGFEEVDAVPTADPGVAYHKVVYCTADSTFYRWDGTQWTKDIDDDTKALLQQEIARATQAERTIEGYLDAHEANHNNPHVVTKSQVGLGNCDNTADLDKPISTATQAALDGKADKATTLAGYGITDAYTKSQDDALLANKADKADTYTKSQVDGFLGGKVDKLGSSPAGTYKSVTVNAQGQVTAGTNPDTLAGYGITDAYTKGEADTLLASKANNNAVVHLAGAETIPGAKTFSGIVTINNVVSQNATSYGFKTVKSPLAIAEYTANNSVLQETWQDKNGINLFRTLRTGNRVIVSANDTSGTVKTSVTLRGDIEALEIPTATGSSPNDTAVNIAYLDGYTPMVRTTGNQTIGGIKTVEGTINGLSNINNGRLYAYHGSGNYWRKKINILQDTSWCAMFLIKSAVKRGINGPAIFVYQRRAGSADFLDWIYKPAGVTMQVGVNDDGIYVYQNGSDGLSIELLGQIASQLDASTIISIADDAVPTDPVFRVTI